MQCRTVEFRFNFSINWTRCCCCKVRHTMILVFILFFQCFKHFQRFILFCRIAGEYGTVLIGGLPVSNFIQRLGSVASLNLTMYFEHRIFVTCLDSWFYDLKHPIIFTSSTANIDINSLVQNAQIVIVI